MKKYLLSVLGAFFTEQATCYSMHVIANSGTTPLLEYFKGYNPPRVGEYIAVEVKETAQEAYYDKRFEYYQVMAVTHIIYKSKNLLHRPKKEATIVVKHVGNAKPSI